MSRTLTQTWVVIRKELRDAFRDRRAIYSVLFGSLFGPVLVGVMINAHRRSAARGRGRPDPGGRRSSTRRR